MKRQQNGFVLPLVVVSGTILLIILSYVMRTLNVNQQSLVNSHLQLLAKQAAESGLARAQQCLQDNNQVTTWDASRPLKPNTDCKGYNRYGFPKFVVENTIYKTTFSVVPSDMQDDFRNVSSVGVVEMFRAGSGQKIREYRQTLSVYIQTGLTFDDIAFGSIYGFGTDIYSGSGAAKQEGVYFFTKTLAGTINGVGSNLDDVLTGYYQGDGTGNPRKGSPSHPNGVKVGFEAGIKVQKIFTDFQGVGWNAYFLTHDNRVYGTGINGNAMIGNNINKPNNAINLGNVPAPKELPIWGTPQMNFKDTEARVEVPLGEVIDRVVFNGSAAYLLTEDKDLYGFGRNWNEYSNQYNTYVASRIRGIVGCHENCNYGRTEFVNRPVKVQVSDDDTNFDSNRQFNTVVTDGIYDATQVTTCAIDTQGKVYCWGDNRQKQISQANKEFYSYGHRVGSFGPGSPIGRAVDVKTDGQTIYILNDRGEVYAQGNNSFGQVGRNNCHKCALGKILNFPTGTKITKISADAFSVLFLAENGKVYGLGLNDVGQLGNGTTITSIKTPREFMTPGDKRATDIFIVSPGVRKENCSGNQMFMCEAKRYRNSMIITEDGSVYAAGSNYYGQLGVGNAVGFSPALDIEYYNSHPDVLSARNGVYSDTYLATPRPVKMYLVEKDSITGQMVHVKAKYVRSGLGMSIVITNKNRVYTVGHNHNGQLGSGDMIDYFVPKAHRLTNQWNVWYY